MTDEVMERAEFAPTSVPARSRWLGPAVGVMVAIVSFGFGGSLSRGTPAESAETVVASKPSPTPVAKSPAVAVQFSGRGGAVALDVSIDSDPPVMRIDGLVDATIRTVEVRVSDDEGQTVATETVDTQALQPVIAYNSNMNGVAALSATVALPANVPPDRLVVEVIAR
jgi:hypothetical protein